MKGTAATSSVKTETQRFVDRAFAEGIRRSFWPDLGGQSLTECIEDALEAHRSLGYRLEAIREKFCKPKPKPNK